jgi:hypothetical protein
MSNLKQAMSALLKMALVYLFFRMFVHFLNNARDAWNFSRSV